MGKEAAARPSKKACRAAASGLTAFGLRLAKHLADAAEGDDGVDGGGQNIMFSPLSIYAALALLSAGARGTTLDEVLAALGVASRDEIAEFVSAVVERALADCSESGAPLIAFACALWHEKTMALKPAYSAPAVESLVDKQLSVRTLSLGCVGIRD